MRYARFEVLTSVMMKIQVSWHMTACRLVSNYRHFGVYFCRHTRGNFNNLDDEGSKLFRNISNYQSTRRYIPECLYLQKEMFERLYFTMYSDNIVWLKSVVNKRERDAITILI
jgi:hypothetical protein